MEPCPDAESLAARPPETHLAACPRCRLLAEAIGEETEPWTASLLRDRLLAMLPARRLAPRLWVPAAAALLLAATLAWREKESPAPPVPVPSPASPDREQVGGGDRAVILGTATLVTLREGSRATLHPELRLLQGMMLLEDPGEAVHLLLGSVHLRLEKGVLLATLDGPEAFSWLPSAWAGEASWRVQVLEGQAVLEADGKEYRLSAGQEASGGVGAPRIGEAGPIVWKGEEGWMEAPGFPASTREGILAADEPPAGDYVWEALFSREAATGVSVLLKVDDRKIAIPLAQAGSGLLRVRATLGKGWLKVEAGGREVFSGPAAEAMRRFPAALACGLRSWGGLLEVRRVRWRAL